MSNTNTKKPYNIHFVCRGNTYRSRLAAAYFHTLVDDRFTVTSSGVGAEHADVEAISPYALKLAHEYKLGHGISKQHSQTTYKLLAEADVIIFMNKDVYDESLKTYELDVRKCQVWHIADIDKKALQKKYGADSDRRMEEEARTTFKKIRRNCKELAVYLTSTAWVDVVDAQNEPTHIRLPMSWVTDRGFWHRGVHVVAQTADGKYVVEKRSKNIVFAPGMLEISLGGGVDSGEHPLQAAARETHEELGVQVHETRFRPLFMYRQIGYHPHYKKQTRCHLYVYSVQLPIHSKDLRPQFDEVAEVRVLSRRQIKRLLRNHRLAHFGRLKWGYQLYRKAVAYSTVPL